MKAKEFIPASKPRNFVVKNQKTAGAGAHRDKKKEQKQGYKKHKGQVAESDVMEYETHRYTDDQGNEWEVNDEGEKTLIKAGWGSSGGRSYNRSRPMRSSKPKGYYFYNVPTDKEQDARAAGLRQTKSGKWFDTMSNSQAERAFGKGRYWEPKESVEEGWREKAAAAALAATIGLGAAGGANARVLPGADPSINRFTGEPVAAQQVKPSDEKKVSGERKFDFSSEYLKKVVDGKHPRPMISVDDAKAELERRGEL